MVVILSKQLTLALRIEKIFGGKELKDDTCDRPDVGACAPIFATDNGLRGAVLASLYVFGIVLGRWGCITQVSDLDGNWRCEVCRAWCR